MGRDADRSVIDLDEAAAVVERQWFVWTAAVSRAEPGESRSLRLRVSRHNAHADVVLHADGWVETNVRRPGATETAHATAQVGTVDEFGLLLDRVVELISWSGHGKERAHAPAGTAGSERAGHWVAGYDGVPFTGET